MYKKLKIIGLLVVILLVFISCSSDSKPDPTESSTKNRTVTQMLHDTVFKVREENSTYQALLGYKNGKVIIKDIQQSESGRNLEKPKVSIVNNQLNVDCTLKKQELYASWKSQQVKEVEIKTITVPKYINRLTFWQKVQIWLGRIFLVVICFYIINRSYVFYRRF